MSSPRVNSMNRVNVRKIYLVRNIDLKYTTLKQAILGLFLNNSTSCIVTGMSAGEAEETQSAYGDGGQTGPGAPTPLSVLEVNILSSSCET